MEIDWNKIDKMTSIRSNTDDMRIALELLKGSNVDLNDPRVHAISWRIDGAIADEYFNDNYLDIKGEKEAYSKYKIYSWK